MNIASEAQTLVLGDRNASYGSPAEDYARTAAVWSGLLVDELKEGVVLTPRKAILMMAALKVCREWHKPKRDNRVDAIGYMLCEDWVVTGERPAAEFPGANPCGPAPGAIPSAGGLDSGLTPSDQKATT